MVNSINKKMFKCLILVLLVAMILSAFVACNNKKDDIKFTDIYKNSKSALEYTKANKIIELPKDISIVTESKDISYGGDYGYIPEIDAFIIKDKNSGFINIIKSGQNKPLLTTSTDEWGFNLTIKAIKYSHSLIAVVRANGKAEVFNLNGKVVIGQDNFSNIPSSTKLEDIINILSNDLVAVSPKFDANINKEGSVDLDYACIYRASLGILQGRVKNESKSLSNLEGYDDYVVVNVDKESTEKVERVVKIPKYTTNTISIITPSVRGEWKDTNVGSDYYSEIVYLGDGIFYIVEDWVVDSSANYTYYYLDDNDKKVYYYVNIYLYDAKKDSLTRHNVDIIFMNITNNYNNKSERTGIAASSFLNDGYMYASYCIVVNPDTKEGDYDQMILNKDLDIVLSLTGNFGLTMRPKDAENVGYFDLAVSYIDDIGIVPILPSVVRAYDIYGKVIFENKDDVVTSCGYNNGMIIATKIIDNNAMYGAYNMNGELKVNFRYTSMTSYMGDYSLGLRKDDNGNKVFKLIGKDGLEVVSMSDHSEPLSDIALDGSSNPIYRVGIYMYRVENKDPSTSSSIKYYYGFKNFNTDSTKNIIMNANDYLFIGGTSLYAPKNNPQYVFVLGKFNGDDHTYVYRFF